MTWFGRLMVALFGRNVPAKYVAQRKSHTLLEIRRPLPRPLRGRKPVTRAFGLGPWAIRTQAGVPLRRRVYWAFPFVRIGHVREWYFPAWLVVWRKGDRVWMTFWPLWHLRDWLFTRCEGCGKRFAWGSGARVATLQHEHRPHTKSIMLGTTGLYHFDCPHDLAAEHRATESWDRQWGHDVGLRQHVLNEPPEVAAELAALAQVRRDANDAYRQRLTESRRERLDGEFRWKFPREESPDPVKTGG